MHALQLDDLPEVKTAAHIVSKMLHGNRNWIQTSFIVAGYDSVKGPQIFQVPPGGAKIEKKIASAGSGSIFVQAYIDANYKEGFSLKECREFLIQGKQSQTNSVTPC